MKQKIIIGLSVGILLFAVYMIARDLFRKPSSAVLAEDFTFLRQIDSSEIGFTRIKKIETGLEDLTGIAVNDYKSLFACGGNSVFVFDTMGVVSKLIDIDSVAKCIAVSGSELLIGAGSSIALYNIEKEELEQWSSFYPDSYITSVTADNEYIYAADANKRLVLKYDKEGNYIMNIGKKDSITGAPGFIIPSLYFDISAGGFNDLWVVNPGRLQMENYSTNGSFRSSWGIHSFSNDGFSGCCNPTQFAVLPDGSFVTYEKGIDKVKYFDPTGSFICLVAGTGSFNGAADSRIGSSTLVKDLAAGPDGSIYILDAFNQISVFKRNNS